MYQVTFNLRQLLRMLSIRNDEEYEIQQIAAATGLNRLTVSKLINGDSGRIEFRTIEKLLEFFKTNGMPITLDQLFTVTDTSERR